MAFLSILKIGAWVLGGIFGLFIVKKTFGKKTQKLPPPPKKMAPAPQKVSQRQSEKEFLRENAVTKENASPAKTNQMSSSEKDNRKELKALLVKVSDLISRGFDNNQISRSIASNSEKDVPKHELIPMIDALKSFLSEHDEKSVKAQEKYNQKAKDDYKAADELAKGNPEFAIDMLSRKLSQLEATAQATKDAQMHADLMEQAGELARHLAVLSSVVSMNSSYEFALKAVELNGMDIKNLDILGYYELGFENISEALQCFDRALALDNSAQEQVWIDLAIEGREIANSKKPDEGNIKGPEKLRSSMDINEIAKTFDASHERTV